MKNKSSAVITAIIIIFVLAIVGGATWYVLSKKQPSPPPPAGEEDQFKDWKTYRNEEYGFEVKYPKDWSVNPTSDKVIIDFLPADKNPMKAIQIFIDSNPQQLSLGEFYDGKPGVELVNSATGGYSSLGIDGKSATRFKDVLGLVTIDVVVIPLNKINIRIEEGIDNREIFNQILSTFKFIK